MSAPETYNEVMRWFGTGHKAGHYDLHGLSLLMTDNWLNTPEMIWSSVLDYNLMHLDSREFWITPRGKVWYVSWAHHEMLIQNLMDNAIVSSVELAGWLRVSKGQALHRTKLSRIQLETLAVLRPDLQPRAVFNEIVRRVPYEWVAKYDVPPPSFPWTIWNEEIDARPDDSTVR